VTFCAPADALALVSLYLRTQGDFLIWKDPDRKGIERFPKGLFYWVGARELLPAGWRWSAVCIAHDHAQGTDDLSYLSGAVFQRITRALQSRDDLLRALNRSQDNDAAEQVLIALDTSLVFLMGALDATARVAHHVLGLPPGDLYEAGWQKTQNWLQNVAVKAPALAAIVATGTAGRDTVTILQLLRNTVHGSGLHALAVSRSGRHEETLVGLPRADSSKDTGRCGSPGRPRGLGTPRDPAERIPRRPPRPVGTTAARRDRAAQRLDGPDPFRDPVEYHTQAGRCRASR
jgi:hypothetical protein